MQVIPLLWHDSLYCTCTTQPSFSWLKSSPSNSWRLHEMVCGVEYAVAALNLPAWLLAHVGPMNG